MVLVILLSEFQVILKILNSINKFNTLYFICFDIYQSNENFVKIWLYIENKSANHSKWVLVYNFLILIKLIFFSNYILKINKLYISGYFILKFISLLKNFRFF